MTGARMVGHALIEENGVARNTLSRRCASVAARAWPDSSKSLEREV